MYYILREQTKKSILDILDESIFTRDGFNCHFNEGDLILSINFNDNDQFNFQIRQDIFNSKWTVSEKPGDTFYSDEAKSYDTFEKALDRINTWIEHILEELSLSSAENRDNFGILRDRINEQAETLPDPDQPFNKAEAVVWERRLDNLVKQFEQLQKEQKVSQLQVYKLQSEVQKLKEQITNIPKRTWVKSAGLRVLRIIETVAASEGHELIDKAVRGLIGDGS
ncbi:MAG: hypothetical protein Q8O92_08340 [Candidatus Latescibacter sp.]|nr:hypothetical protein [Candidatus Latescibacter sp.]